MLVAVSGGHLIMAADAQSGQPCFCPACHEAVILRHGQHKIPHFAHRPGSQCCLAAGESHEHLLGKQQLLRRARQRGYQAALEVYLPQIAQRPDLLLTINDRQVAIEFQCSPLSLQRLRERNAGYQQCGIRFCWLLGAPYRRRRLQQAKIAQFTQWVNGQPALLFWDTVAGHLAVKRDFKRCSFIRREMQDRQMVIKYQSQQLSRLQYGRGSSLVSRLALASPHHFPLAACPLVCHDTTPRWPVIKEPLIFWRLRVVQSLLSQPLFRFWFRDQWFNWLERADGIHWLGYGCIAASRPRQFVLMDFTQDLLAAQVIVACPGGYVLLQHPQWFPSLETKLSYLRKD